MRGWVRRLRGAIGLGLAWATAWFASGMILMLAFPGAADVPFPVLWGGFGFLGGVIFSGVLGALEGRRGFDQMSLPRFAGWGGVGGFLVGVFTLAAVMVGETAPLDHALLLCPVFALAGAGSAAGSLALARRAEEPDRLGDGGTSKRIGTGDGRRRSW